MSKNIRRMSKQMGSHAWKSLMKSAPETAAERDRLKALNVELLETVEELLKEAPRGTTYLKARSLLAKAEDA